jgi:hypothetical protein
MRNKLASLLLRRFRVRSRLLQPKHPTDQDFVRPANRIAPVTERSGKRKWVHFRWACPKFLRQSFHEWAGHSIAQSTWARAYYEQQRDRGSDHHAAVRALAFKWIRILFRCWKDRVAYDESKYLAALAKRGSSLGKLAVVGMATSLWNPCGS